jgi:Centrosome microtubule-binding domain of Cep57
MISPTTKRASTDIISWHTIHCLGNSIYLELAEQYGIIDAASNVAKRNVLADHLREVIDTLEQKGDQIASLYDLLNFQDQPLPRGGIPSRPKYAAVV